MESPRKKNSLTESQWKAVRARGNVLVMAGAGTGKTHTLVERCLDCLGNEHAALDEILVVTFTEAAATEMKRRLRRVLEEKTREDPDDPFFAEQLALFDAAHIGTLHGFCFKLVREHFYELGLDPQPTVLDEGEARLLADETLAETFQEQYEGRDEFAAAVQSLIQTYGGARDEKIRSLVLRLHHYAQTRPDAEGWLAGQLEIFSTSEPPNWQKWLLTAIQEWHDEWLPVLEALRADNEKAAELLGIVQPLQKVFSRELAAEVLEQVLSADGDWPARRKTALRKPLAELFDDARFLASVAPVAAGNDPLAEDWKWMRTPMTALLRLVQDFAARFAARKRDDGVLDFHDLVQFAIKLLWNFAADKPAPTAERWRRKLRFVFVDEYQDINAAQDKIIQALSRSGTDANRFLVGDVKQSIYRFRLADPKIFRDYAGTWRGNEGQTIPLADNFRSREPLLNLVNSLFELFMREAIGGVNYDGDAKLKFASPEKREDFNMAIDPSPRTDLLLRLKKRPGEVSVDENGDFADLEESDKEARLLARHLDNLKRSGREIWDGDRKMIRAVEWRDMAVLLRAPSGKAGIFAKEFEHAGVPLVVARGGFYETSEVLDLLSLLQLLDNPLQDVPCIAVLRSPLVACSLDELAEIRLVAGGHFWFALVQIQDPKSQVRGETRSKTGKFLERFGRWRKRARQVSLSQCLEEVLAEMHYADWLQSRPRGAQRRANVEQFLNLAQRFDQYQRQGLFRFLRFIEAQREAGAEPEVALVADENAVRLMSIHQSKGLEFPVVVIADMGKAFNEQDLRGEIILDGQYGLCPRIQPPHTGGRYSSLPHWLAQRRQRRELRGEELRLLYVAMTRARDTLILCGGITQKKWDELWAKPIAPHSQAILAANSFADWLRLWFSNQVQNLTCQVPDKTQGELSHLRWQLVADAELDGDSASGSPGDEAQSETIPGPSPASGGEDDGAVENLRARMEWKYPFKAATERKAKSSVTELRRAAEELDDEAEHVFSFRNPAKRTARSLISPGQNRALSAIEAGTAHHKFLQHFAPGSANSMETLAAEARRLEQKKILSVAECAALDLEAIAAFWNSKTGRKIQAKSENLRRELAFTARFSPRELADITGAKSEPELEDEFVVVQGVADLVVLLPEEIWLVDFKTDRVSAGEFPSKTQLYSPQLRLYARALGRIYSRPVSKGWLHFLDARKTVEVEI